MRGRAGTRANRPVHVTLTRRQEEVMQLLQRGYTNGQIAEALGISLDGAKFHVGEIIQKLGASSREEAVELWASRPRRMWPAFAGGSALKWVGVAVSGVVVLGAVSGWMALLDSKDGDAVDGKHPEPVFAGPTVPPVQGGLVACPSPAAVAGQRNTIADWVDFVRFEGREYLGRGFVGPQTIPLSSLREPYGRVEVNVSETPVDPWSSRQDCEAAFLPAGEILYRIDGYDPRFRIATGAGRLYEAYSGAKDGRAKDFVDIAGKVIRITVSREDTGASGIIDEARTVQELTATLLASPFSTAPQSPQGPQLFLRFDLSDGTSWRRAFYPDANLIAPGITVPEWVTAAFADALSR